jgi:hypothetical protein
LAKLNENKVTKKSLFSKAKIFTQKLIKTPDPKLIYAPEIEGENIFINNE